MKQKIKMIAFDLDGTVLTPRKELTDYTRQVLKKAVEQGIAVLPATGRPLSGVPEEILNFPGIRYAVTANGARIVDLQTGQTIYEELVSVEIARNVLDIFEHYDTLREVYYNGVGYAEERALQCAFRYLEHKPMAAYVLSTRKPVEDLRKFFETQNMSVDKVQGIFSRIEDKNAALKELRLVENIEITGALHNNIEVNAKGVNKGNALIWLAGLLQIAREEIAAFGDGANDIEMLRLAGCGVCMANGMDEVKRAADYIALSNKQNGVAKFLEQNILW